MTRSIADMLIGLTQCLDQPVQRLGRGLAVLDQREADKACARIEPIRLQSCEVAAGYHTHAGFLVESDGYRFVAAELRDVEPDAEAAGGSAIAVAVAENLVGEIELDPIEPAIFLDMRLVTVSGDRD